ncbi:Protein Skeletor, isoforms D/E [Aphelenchoides besseyi]|nr:Protein Skeletor, isoforms D/E [Aphelenchoides besseyi]
MAVNLATLFAITIVGILSRGDAATPEQKYTTNTYDAKYGVFLGSFNDLANSELRGDVWLVNETAIQVINFNFNGNLRDAYFWLSRTETPSKDGLKIPTYETGITPLPDFENVERIVLNIPDQHRIGEFKNLAVYSPSTKLAYGSVVIPDDVIVPKSHFLSKELAGNRYNIGSGPILILDTRTIKIFAFTFDGDKAPDGYFFVGRGLNLDRDVGSKVPIRGRDSPNSITPLNTRYRGGQDIIIDLPENFDVYHIDLLSVYCYKFRIDFGHVQIGNLPANLPPYIPPQTKFSQSTVERAWSLQPLLGNAARSNFTLHLGPPGGARGYQAITGLRAPENVWYVNGFLAEIYLKRGMNYLFVIEGGKSNPFYISDDPYGGYSKLLDEEKEKVRIFAPKTPSDVFSDRRCIWETNEQNPSSKFESFNDFRETLRLNCDEQGTVRSLNFTPTNSTPSLIYGNSYGDYNMGFKMRVVDELPENIPDIQEPLQFEALHKTNRLTSFAFEIQHSKWLLSLCSLFLLR